MYALLLQCHDSPKKPHSQYLQALQLPTFPSSLCIKYRPNLVSDHPYVYGRSISNKSLHAVLHQQVPLKELTIYVYANAASISYNFMGVVLSVFVGGAVLPVSFVLFWGGCTAQGACVGTLLGGICSVIAWVVTAQKMYVTASVLSLQNNEPVVAGCCVGVGLAAVVCTVIVSCP